MTTIEGQKENNMVYQGNVRSTSLMTGEVPTSPTQKVVVVVRPNADIIVVDEEHQNDDDKGAIESLKGRIETVWREDSDSGSNQQEEMKTLFDEMIVDREQLLRILVARKYEMEACIDLFFEQLRFRARWKPQCIQSIDIPNAIPSGAWRLSGYSKEGIVISNYKLRLWQPGNLGSDKDDLDGAVTEYTKYVLFMLEAMIAKMKDRPIPQKFIVLFDLRGFTVSLIFRKDVRLMIRKLIYIAQAQYPERLYKAFLVNAPMGFESAWRLIRALLDEKTASKVSFLNQTSLQDEIDPEVLSTEYGGLHEEYPVHG